MKMNITYMSKVKVVFLLLGIIILSSGCIVHDNTTDVVSPVTDYVWTPIVNNTNLAPDSPGHPPGTGERVSGVTYWANDTSIELFVFAHAMNVGDNSEIHLFINGTKVADTSGRPLGGAESSNKTIIATIPFSANYTLEFFNFHHYEWYEYPYNWTKIH